MATFKGSSKEFKRFMGPRLRNVVNSITKRHRTSVGSCEHCGVSRDLHSAHVHGKDRIAIIDSILDRSKRSRGQTVEVDLDEFERRFKDEHSPVEKAIFVLCNACHRRYDKKPFGDPGFLPITLDPPKASDFVSRLLKTKKAEIRTYFSDGRVRRQMWNVRRFTRNSSLYGNLRSRSEFRKGQWKNSGIAKVHVRIVMR